MIGGRGVRRVLVGVLGLAVGACAAAPPKLETPAATPAPPPAAAPVAVAPAPPPPTTLEQLVAGRVRRARELEQAGRLRDALDQWKIALTLRPDDPVALAGRRGLEAQIEDTITERTRQGREALAKKEYLDARRHFLAVLAMDPGNRTAFEALQTEVREFRYLTYTVRRGDTLATIAERFYGDRARSEVIWETNQLPSNPRLAEGSTLRIPEIPGVPFVHERPAVAAVAPVAPGAAPAPVALPAVPDTTAVRPEIDPLLVEAKEAFDKGDYAEALSDVDRLLASNARNEEGLELKKSILYGLGRAQFGQKKYGDSYKTLTQLASLAPNYRDVNVLIRQSREPLVEQHYLQGVRLFQAERLQDAMGEWRKVLEYDPQHVNAKRNLEQAERLLRNLQQRQQPGAAPKP